ncbi:sulfurtransferase [Paraliobacillus zengyii]|uniref:sulfurtransferase n=1 Tax=Paraliobacillus zengyii TaxID=2213194 RepID=UPI0013A6C8AD|nr:sulfurtransferase [Paraliobacillus zengyii]
MMILVVFLLVIIGYMLYARYYPVKGVPCMDEKESKGKNASITLDIRDYNTSSKESLNDSIFIPIAYLKRYHHEIPSKYIYLIASDKIEKNLGIRLLSQRGYQVIGYKLANCNCKDKLRNLI